MKWSSSCWKKSGKLVLSVKLYGNLRLKHSGQYPRIFWCATKCMCASESFDLKWLPFLSMSSKSCVFSGSSTFSSFWEVVTWLQSVFVRVRRHDQYFCLVCVVPRNEMLLTSSRHLAVSPSECLKVCNHCSALWSVTILNLLPRR